MTRADIESTEKQDIRCRYVGKQAPWASRKKLTGMVAIGGKELVKLESEHSEKERLEVEKVVRNTVKGKKVKRRQRSLQNRRHIPPAHPLNSACRS